MVHEAPMTTPTTTLTLRDPALPARTADVLTAFDALEPGASLLLVADHEPKPILAALLAQRPGRFEWNVLDSRPGRCRTEVRRRPTDAAPTVGDCMGRDHRRLDGIMSEVRSLVARGAVADAAARYEDYSTGLHRHIQMEEQVLFPAFEELTGMTEGPTVVMRNEHVEIRGCLQAIRDALAAADATRAERNIDALEAVLGDHDMKEEGMLYPMTDEAAGSDEARAEIVRRMQLL
jgi:uncharacterized protein (DUF2249 family)/hemerythrin-like domain-containing protein